MIRRILPIIFAFILAFAALAEGDMSHIADAADMTDVADIVPEGMQPVTADALNDGAYDVAVDCSSSMFKIIGCRLTVADGQMTALLTMKSQSYSHFFPGTAEEAAAAPAEDLIPLTVEGEDYTFALPVPALNTGVDCAAFSVKKQLWYPRTLLFRADSLPDAAWRDAQIVTAQSLNLADGEYLVDVSLVGGRASVESPARMAVEGGACRATLVFSTSKIDYVLMDGEKYLPEPVEGGAAFTVPVAAFDRGLSLIVDSTAIQPAVEVPYTVTFDSASIAAQ